MTLDVDEFLRRFLLHLLPPGFVRIRNFGFLANRTALRACLCAFGFSAAQRRWLLRQHHRHRSDSLALELPDLRRNHAHRRTALRCATPASLSTSTRSVRSMKTYLHPRPLPCFGALADPLPNDPGLRGTLSPELANDTLLCYFTAPSHHQSGKFHSAQSVPDPSAPAQAHSKYIGSAEGGFLQVAVSEAPRARACNCVLLRAGALQIQH